jgi:hypothetical protein
LSHKDLPGVLGILTKETMEQFAGVEQMLGDK